MGETVERGWSYDSGNCSLSAATCHQEDKINVNYSSRGVVCINDISKGVDWPRKSSPGFWWFLA